MEQNKHLLENIDKKHTTSMGESRIRKNLNLENIDVVAFCKEKISGNKCHIYRQGKNWYCETGGIKFTINSNSYTIITAHKI